LSHSLDAPIDVPARGVVQGARALAAAVRPKQFTKNLLTLAGIVFAAKVTSLDAWSHALLAFGVYCAASSAAYLLNDIHDLASDRLHPVKRLRPLASGRLPLAAARWAIPVFVAAALGGSAFLGHRSLGWLVLFLVVQAAYTLWLKRVPLLDVALIASLFEIRAVAGAEAIGVPSSGWLLACTPLLASLLAFGKRRAELELVRGGSTPGRTVLRWYSRRRVDLLLVVSGVSAVSAYTAYALAGPTPWLATTLPFVLVGVARYFTLLYRHGAGEEPENMVLTDSVLMTSTALWAILCAVVLATA
jgi:decaprenyl-phosphate phosphoribosyltransferase